MTSVSSLRGLAPPPGAPESPRLPDIGQRLPDARDLARQERARRERAQQQQQQEPAHPLLRPPSAGLGVEAFEEITFQASEREEAEVHDELHDHHVREAHAVRGTIPVEKVMAVMRLMEGHRGYQMLRMQARLFAGDFMTDREGALERLKPASMRPEVRLSVMRMAEDLLEQVQDKPEAAEALASLRQLEDKDANQIHHLVKVFDATQPKGEGKASAPDSLALQLLASPMSTRVLLDAVGSPEGLDALRQQIQRLPAEGRFQDAGTFVGMSVGLAHMMAVLRTMGEHAAHLGGELRLPPVEQGKLLRGLLDMCRTAAPRPKLEKLRGDTLRVAGADKSLRFDLELMKQVSQYPESVWVNIDAKSAVQTWLREAQGLHYRREGALDMTGHLDRNALRPVAPTA